MPGVVASTDIADAIKNAHPENVAVAYVGADWEKFLPDLAQVKNLIVAPVLGTNPQAVLAIERKMRQIHGTGWDRIHFLDSLHAKLYLGKESAVYGSANLSQRGLSGDQLVELCRSTDDQSELAELYKFFKGVLKKAKVAYPNIKSKKKRLERLATETSLNPWAGRGSKRRRQTTFAEFELLSSDQFYVGSYETDNLEYAAPAQQLESIIDDMLCVLPADKVEQGKWVLCWKYDPTRSPYLPTGDLHWMRIDEIVLGGVRTVEGEPTDYNTLVFQRVDRPVGTAEVPFALDAKVKEAFVLAFKNQRLAKAMQADKLDVTRKFLPSLITEMRQYL